MNTKKNRGMRSAATSKLEPKQLLERPRFSSLLMNIYFYHFNKSMLIHGFQFAKRKFASLLRQKFCLIIIRQTYKFS